MADILNDILLWSQVMSCFLKLVNVVATLLAMMPMMVKMNLSMLMVDGGGDEPDSVNGVVMVFISSEGALYVILPYDYTRSPTF